MGECVKSCTCHNLYSFIISLHQEIRENQKAQKMEGDIVVREFFKEINELLIDFILVRIAYQTMLN